VKSQNQNNKTALVTGSASGIGKKILLRLSEKGFKVIINYRNDEKSASELIETIRKQERNALMFKADVTDSVQVKNMFEFIINEWGRLDVLVNNVGDFIMKGNLDYSPGEWSYMIESNLSSAYYCCREAIPHMWKQQYGRIINIAMASSDRIHSVSSTLPYTIAKTGIITLTRSLAKDYARHNITVNAISPGVIDNGKLTGEMKSKMSELIPSGKIGTPDDIAHAVLFLVSPDSAYINGTNIIVSAGWEV